MQTRKTGIGGVFGGSRRTHGDDGRNAIDRQLRMRREDVALQVIGHGLGFDAGPQFTRHHADGFKVLRVQHLNARAHRATLFQRVDEPVEGRRTHDKARRHIDAGTHQFTQAAALTAHAGAVCKAYVSKPADRLFGSHRQIRHSRVTTPRPPSTRMR